MSKNLKIVRLSLSCLLVSLACSAPSEDIAPLPVEEGFYWSSSMIYLSIDDLWGSYKLLGTATSYFSPPPTTYFHGDAFSEDGYARVDEVGDVLALEMVKVEGVEVRGGPVYDFHQILDYPSIFCELEMDGRAELEELPEWSESIPDRYDFFGTVWVRCFGDEVAMEAGHWYDEPGELVGQVDAFFGQRPIEDP